MIENLIKYQNESEKKFKQEKNLKTILHYLLSLIIFFTSTLISAYTFPFRYLYKKVFKSKTESEIIHVNDKNLDAILDQESIVLMDFWAEWCGPCLMMNSMMEQFAKESKNIKILKVNADINRSLMQKFNIRGLPQFVLIQSGEEVKRHAGPMTMTELSEFCDPRI